MKKRIVFYLVLMFFLQFSFFPFFIPALKINFLLIFSFLIIRAREDEFRENIFWLAFCGLLFDVFSIYPLGTGILSFLTVGFLLNLFQKKISADDNGVLPDIMLIVLTKLIFDGGFFLISNFTKMIGISQYSFKINIFSINYLLQLAIFAALAFSLLAISLKLKKRHKNEIKIF